MSTADLGKHVQDVDFFEWPFGELSIPQPFEAIGIPLHLTKFMVLEVVAGLLMIAVFVPLARRIATGAPPKGRFWNMFETVLLFLRDEVARPAIGPHDADRFLPFLWNLFFFILFCNLLGIVPWAGSPTGSLSVTAALAAISFCVVVGAGVAKFGLAGYGKSLVPPMEVPRVLGIFLVPMIFVIEVLGLLIKHVVLAVRLLANMFAGHLVLAVITGFIVATANAALVLWLGVTITSVLGAAALTLLELFVAFLQAYIFTFLLAIFIGMAAHPH
jgi:F-type H+-transporting ATPase subunit a